MVKYTMIAIYRKNETVEFEMLFFASKKNQYLTKVVLNFENAL